MEEQNDKTTRLQIASMSAGVYSAEASTYMSYIPTVFGQDVVAEKMQEYKSERLKQIVTFLNTYITEGKVI